MTLNRHEFEQAAKHFRAGRLTLKDFSDQLFPKSETAPPASDASAPQTASPAVPKLPQRKIDAHKGDFGRILAIGGCRTMPGAIGLTAMAALRTGSGLVVVATPYEAAPVVAGYSPCYITEGYEVGDALARIAERIEWADVIALGPGIRMEPPTISMVRQLYKTASQPIVVDADALNCLDSTRDGLKTHKGQRILTPHPGEFRRLTGSTTTSREEAEQTTRQLAADNDIVVLLKGAGTFVADGQNTARNETGNPGMATGGSGDVLTGMIASLIGQGLSPFDAARLAAHVHGHAGDLAAAELGQASLIASDLLEFLPAALKLA